MSYTLVEFSSALISCNGIFAWMKSLSDLRTICHERISLLLDALTHPDEPQPELLEAFARQFLRRVNAEFAAAGDSAGDEVKHFGRAFGEDAVAPRVGVIRILAEIYFWRSAKTET